jgi:class 3 adenylate cyclase
MPFRRRRFDRPDAVRQFEGGRLELLEMGDVAVGRVVFEPGWRWSTHLRPLVGGESCQVHHLGYVVSGRLHIETDDGASMEVGPGDVYETPPGHDAWVIGIEPWVAVDYTGRRLFAVPPEAEGEGSLATVLFTDLSGSTERARALGNARWQALLARHNEASRQEIERFGGHEVQHTGDGFLVRFDSPARAVRCAAGMIAAVSALDLQLRAGIHSGEIQVVDRDVRGIAVHVAARILAIAEPGEILVSATVRDLLAGSGMEFVDRGIHELRGAGEPRQLYRVVLQVRG